MGLSVFAEEGRASLRFLAAVETLESDLWQQYNELGGIQDSEVPGGSGSAAYIKNRLMQCRHCLSHSETMGKSEVGRYKAFHA
jgi:hypothetical protein